MARIEIDSKTSLEHWMASGPDRPPAVFQCLDLIPYETELIGMSLVGCQFLGCTLSPRLLDIAHAHRCLVYDDDGSLPFRQFRATLYTPDELFAGFNPAEPKSYSATLDWTIYLTYADPQLRRPLMCGLDLVLARRLHDNSISDALEELIVGRENKVVAIMGGHDRRRSHPSYRAVALLAHTLTNRGFLVASGGGPGIMEAANLGAFFAPWDPQCIDDAIRIIGKNDSDQYNDAYWLARAWEVRNDALGKGLVPGLSIGIPTWFYGHEPPNPFASTIAKYFENSLREEGLLALGLGGVVFAEGNAGTVQEIFQDACQNYYRTYGNATHGFLSPMVLLDDTYWNAKPNPAQPKAKPLYPLLQSLASEKTFSDYLLLTGPIDAGVVEQVVDFIVSHPPIPR